MQPTASVILALYRTVLLVRPLRPAVYVIQQQDTPSTQVQDNASCVLWLDAQHAQVQLFVLHAIRQATIFCWPVTPANNVLWALLPTV